MYGSSVAKMQRKIKIESGQRSKFEMGFSARIHGFPQQWQTPGPFRAVSVYFRLLVIQSSKGDKNLLQIAEGWNNWKTFFPAERSTEP